MAVIKYLDEHGLETLVKQIKKRTTSIYTVKGEAIYADADYVAHAAAGDFGYEISVTSTGLWKLIDGTWTKLTAFEEGYVYSIVNPFTTDSDFIEGAGEKITAGTNIVVVKEGTETEPVYKWDLFASALQLDEYQTKKLVTPLTVFNNETVTEYTTFVDLPKIEVAAAATITENMIAIMGEGDELGDVYRAHVAPNDSDPTKNDITWVKLGDQLTVEGALQFLGNVAANTPITNAEILALFE